jgi:hypothetical protein
MQLKLFILPVKNLDAAEGEMNAFLRSHRVLAVKKELVSDGENSLGNDRIMAGQNHKSQRGRAQATNALRCERLEVHRQIQHMILSCHDSVIPLPNDLPYAD